MENLKINGKTLKEAIEHYGSLMQVLESLESKKRVLGEDIKKRRKKILLLKQKKNKLDSKVNGLKVKYVSEKKRLALVAEKADKWERQYDLFQGFLAMLLTSPSVSTSLKILIDLLQELIDSGWSLTNAADEMRGLFVRKVMGDYLKSFRCKQCGARFITNHEPVGSIHSKSYVCPCCHISYKVEPDDTFLKVMVSEKQLVDIITAGELKKENEILQPLKPFFNVICEVCGKPVTEWDVHNAKIAAERKLWGHTECWSSDFGQLVLFAESSTHFKSG